MLFMSTLKKGQKWPNHFISGKQFQKRPNGNPENKASNQNSLGN